MTEKLSDHTKVIPIDETTATGITCFAGDMTEMVPDSSNIVTIDAAVPVGLTLAETHRKRGEGENG